MAKRIASKELTHDNWADEEEPEEMGTFRQASTQQLAARQIKKARRRGAPDSPQPSGIFKGLAPFSGFGNNKDSSSQPTFSFMSKETTSDDTPKPTFSFFSNISSNTTDSTKSEFGSSGNKTVTQPFQFSHEPVSSNTKSSDTVKTNGLDPSTDKSTNGTSGKSGSKQFLSHLKSLNEGVLSWVKQHLDKNPHVDLTPVFDDYKKHFDGLVKRYPPSKSENDTDSNAGDSKKNEGSEKENKPLITEKASKESTRTPTFSFGVSTTSTKPSDSKPFSFGTDTKGTNQKEGSKDSTGKPMSIFGAQDGKSSENSIFGKASTGFVFGGISSGQSANTGFSFTKSSTAEESKGSGEGATADEPSDEPPVVEVNEVKEEDALYEKKCKLFYMKDGAYVEKGVGTLFLKPAGDKTQLLVRALTNLGNILLNIFLTKSIPAVRAGKNGIMIACIPNPPLEAKNSSTDPVKMLIRVKTTEDADQLLEKINELKK